MKTYTVTTTTPRPAKYFKVCSVEAETLEVIGHAAIFRTDGEITAVFFNPIKIEKR